MKLGHVSINFVQIMADTLEAEGTDPSSLLDKFNFTQEKLSSPQTRVSLSKVMYFGREALLLCEKPWFGLLMGEHNHFGNQGLAGWAAMTAPNLSEALASHIRLETLNSRNIRGHSNYYLSENNNPVCHFYSLEPYNQYNYFCVDSALSSWYQLAQQITGQRELLQSVEIEYKDLGFRERFEEYFQCPVRFGADRNLLTLLPHTAELKSLTASPSCHQLALQLAEKELRSQSSSSRFSDQVTEIITQLLSGQPPEIEQVAEKLGMAKWTLRRRLKEENTGFKELLDNTRRDLAMNYVSDSIYSFSEIAYILGFSSPAAFHRAFKRWTQTLPGEYRKSRADTKRF